MLILISICVAFIFSTVSHKVNHFGFRVFNELTLIEEEDNIVFSPFSVFYSLSLLRRSMGLFDKGHDQGENSRFERFLKKDVTEEFFDFSEHLFNPKREAKDHFILGNSFFFYKDYEHCFGDDFTYELLGKLPRKNGELSDRFYYFDFPKSSSSFDHLIAEKMNSIIADDSHHIIDTFFEDEHSFSSSRNFFVSTFSPLQLSLSDVFEPSSSDSSFRLFRSFSDRGNDVKSEKEVEFVERVFRKDKVCSFGSHNWKNSRLQFESVKLGLKGGFELLLILPSKRMKYYVEWKEFIKHFLLENGKEEEEEQVIRRIHEEQRNQRQKSQKQRKVILPKFEIEHPLISLDQITREEFIFRFSNILFEIRKQKEKKNKKCKDGSNLLGIDDLYQRSSIRFDENGLYSPFKLKEHQKSKKKNRNLRNNKKQIPEILFNQPFIFFVIHEQSEMILQMGSVVNPIFDSSSEKQEKLIKILNTKEGGYDYVHDSIETGGTSVFIKQMIIFVIGISFILMIFGCGGGIIYYMTQKGKNPSSKHSSSSKGGGLFDNDENDDDEGEDIDVIYQKEEQEKLD